MAWIIHDEEEALSFSDDDDLHDVVHNDEYIDNVDVILEHIRARKFIDVD